ncbi:hypothetical protein KM043_000122 [Ampulex compressa]|nr:hypothetical protein KM043_000122 [Ampulex compressa]
MKRPINNSTFFFLREEGRGRTKEVPKGERDQASTTHRTSIWRREERPSAGKKKCGSMREKTAMKKKAATKQAARPSAKIAVKHGTPKKEMKRAPKTFAIMFITPREISTCHGGGNGKNETFCSGPGKGSAQNESAGYVSGKPRENEYSVGVTAEFHHVPPKYPSWIGLYSSTKTKSNTVAIHWRSLEGAPPTTSIKVGVRYASDQWEPIALVRTNLSPTTDLAQFEDLLTDIEACVGRPQLTLAF